MDPDNLFQLFAIGILILLSFFFSSAETALTTCNKLRMKTLADDGNKAAALLLKVTSNSGKMLGAILVGNNIVNITASSLSTIFVQDMWGNAFVSVGTGALTLVVLIFGEITPKTIASHYADELSLFYIRIIYALMWLLTPIIFITNTLSGIILKIFRVDISKKQTTFTENELRTIMDVSHEEGVIEAEEKKMINNVFDFGETQAKDIMVPRIDMCMIDIDSSYEDIMDIFKKDRYTRIPVCDGDDVVGILNIKDLLLYQPGNTFNIKDYLRPAFFTYEYKNLSELMIEIKKCSVNIIIVLDEYGVTAGLLTFEDILEEIVGDIRDEYDYDEEDIIEKVHDNEYLIDAQISLDDLNDKISLDLSSEAYDTLGGFIIEHLDRLAKEGDKVEYENLLLLVEKMDKKRIDTVRLLIKEEVAE